jgi:hypothetical protein
MGNDFPTAKNWRFLYEAALSETDRSRLPARIAEVRAAILNLEEAAELSPSELRAREDALRDLERLAEIVVAGEVA